MSSLSGTISVWVSWIRWDVWDLDKLGGGKSSWCPPLEALYNVCPATVLWVDTLPHKWHIPAHPFLATHPPAITIPHILLWRPHTWDSACCTNEIFHSQAPSVHIYPPYRPIYATTVPISVICHQREWHIFYIFSGKYAGYMEENTLDFIALRSGSSAYMHWSSWSHA